MIQRYALAWEMSIQYRNFSRNDLRSFSKNQFNIYPGAEVPIIIDKAPEQLRKARFGFLKGKKKLMYNIHRNDLISSPSLYTQRCLIPASAFYFIPPENDPYLCLAYFSPLSFAGIWITEKDPDSEEIRYSFCMITIEAYPMLKKIGCSHMPVFLKKEQEDKWLDTAFLQNHLDKLLVSFPEKEINAFPVGKRIRCSRVNIASLSFPVGTYIQQFGWEPKPILGSKRYLCPNCCIDKFLRKYVSMNARDIAKCNICRKKTRCLLVDEDLDMIRLFRAIHRLTFEDVTRSCMAYVLSINDELLLERGVYEGRNSVLKNIGFENWYNKSRKSIEQANLRLEYHIYLLEHLLGRNNNMFDLYPNYDQIEPSAESPLCLHPDNQVRIIDELFDQNKEIKSYSQNISRAKELFKRNISDKLLARKIHLLKKIFYRARMGYDKSGFWGIGHNYFDGAPYTHKSIGAPPPELARQGRLNMDGIPILYLSSDIHTAICEIRPEPGAYVSLGIFELKESDLRVIDLREIDLLNFFQTEESLLSYYLFTNISKKLSQPVLSDVISRYKITQIFSESVAELGYDGILYNSAVTTGYNLAIFDPSKFQYKDGSASLHLVNKVKYDISLFASYPHDSGNKH